MRTRHFADTNTGLRRDRNEEAYLAHVRLGLFLVCEGVGGEIASATLTDLLWASIEREEPLLREAGGGSTRGPDASPPPVSDELLARVGAMLRGAVEDACDTILDTAGASADRRSMSPAASVALVVSDRLVVAQVGNSRVFLARGGEARALIDDPACRQWRASPSRTRPGASDESTVPRALGLRGLVEVDIRDVPVHPGDRLLLCSDGLHACVESRATLAELFELELHAAAKAAIRHANAGGGADNVTALFVEFLPEGGLP